MHALFKKEDINRMITFRSGTVKANSAFVLVERNRMGEIDDKDKFVSIYIRMLRKTFRKMSAFKQMVWKLDDEAIQEKCQVMVLEFVGSKVLCLCGGFKKEYWRHVMKHMGNKCSG